ncbi:ribosomal protection-like ABC-F family protein [Amycolatopsis sp. BJA-103]|uniref:ribosomal protection-like ABC-F family protein n=1 Tax=Amycolatopsis sp. BJA-103 TaxID=1911175 RepID=UPI000C78AA3D|nr:ABC-F family ATP-binding cassette domain-containing protein [Amycolatopsis sp. BJA-103]AUI58828.1 tylosin resistance protein TlrC [Amycolatopsis sp. BJA-103]PNE17721.1 tylosin resistance protein TlrC [Amycolatopsis sp. BJA-103]
MRTPHRNSGTQLVLSGVTKRFDDHVVLDQVGFTVKPGEKAGVIGDNGSGKSTLLRLIAGHDRADNGTVTVTAPGGVGYLPQTSELPGTATVGDAIDLALADIRELESRLRAAEKSLATAEDLDVYGDLTAAYEARGGYEADARVEVALHGLGQPGLDRGRALGSLSGGQRSRLALAATLAASPELLLLDEPTNDLDDEAVAWLENHLRGHRGRLVAITHDRMFLSRVTTTILEVDADRRTVHRHGDGYPGYLAAKAAARARWVREYEVWQLEMARQERLADVNIDRFSAIPRKAPAAFSGAGAFRARSRAHGAMSRIRSARERIQRLEADPVPPPPRPLRFTGRIDAGEVEADRYVVEADGVSVDGRLPRTSLCVLPGERVLVTGPNGAGKTTLMRVLAGELAPSAGSSERAGRVGFLHQNGGLGDDTRTAIAVFAGDGDEEEAAERLLSLGLFRAPDLRKPVRELSVGQRRRLELAKLVTARTDLLLLDEPTNHLAPDLVEEMEQALADYSGALVVVTHDRRLRRTFEGRRLELASEPVAV